jgi:hypothetical protein
MQCPLCGKNNNTPTKSWQYGIFRVDGYSCECGGKFREYKSIHLNIDVSNHIATKGKLEEHRFTLLLKNGKWIKILN